MRENKPVFNLGRVVITPAANELADKDGEALKVAIRRHHGGDWGEICADDKQLNDEALTGGGRLMSAHDVAGERVWIITEANREYTTIFKPDEY